MKIDAKSHKPECENDEQGSNGEPHGLCKKKPKRKPKVGKSHMEKTEMSDNL